MFRSFALLKTGLFYFLTVEFEVVLALLLTSHVSLLLYRVHVSQNLGGAWVYCQRFTDRYVI